MLSGGSASVDMDMDEVSSSFPVFNFGTKCVISDSHLCNVSHVISYNHFSIRKPMSNLRCFAAGLCGDDVPSDGTRVLPRGPPGGGALPASECAHIRPCMTKKN